MDECIYSIKLTSGEEIITRLIGGSQYTNIFELNDTPKLLLDKPRVIMMTQQGAVALVPLVISGNSETPVVLLQSAIACWNECDNGAFKTEYLKSVSNLVIPNKQILTE
jgi:hypothetical protein